MFSEREVNNCDFNEMGMYILFRNNIWFIIVLSLCWIFWYFVCFYIYIDCIGVFFVKELCVNCKFKLCLENVICYVLVGKCFRWYYLKKYVIGEKDIDGNLGRFWIKRYKLNLIILIL